MRCAITLLALMLPAAAARADIPPMPVIAVDEMAAPIILAGKILSISEGLPTSSTPRSFSPPIAPPALPRGTIVTIQVDETIAGDITPGRQLVFTTRDDDTFESMAVGERKLVFLTTDSHGKFIGFSAPTSAPAGKPALPPLAQAAPVQRALEAVAWSFADPISQNARIDDAYLFATTGMPHERGEARYAAAYQGLYSGATPFPPEVLRPMAKAVFARVIPYTQGIGRYWAMAAATERGDSQYVNALVDAVLDNTRLSILAQNDFLDALASAHPTHAEIPAMRRLLNAPPSKMAGTYHFTAVVMFRSLSETEPAAILELEPKIDSTNRGEAEDAIGNIISALQICQLYEFSYLERPENRHVLHDCIKTWREQTKTPQQ